jgi:hypothetical protein
MALIITPSPNDYASIEVGKSRAQTFIFSADDVQRIYSIVSTDSQFVVESGYGPGEGNVPFLVYPGQTHEVTISCTPTEFGEITTNIIIDNEQANYTDEDGTAYVDENGDFYINGS